MERAGVDTDFLGGGRVLLKDDGLEWSGSGEAGLGLSAPVLSSENGNDDFFERPVDLVDFELPEWTELFIVLVGDTGPGSFVSLNSRLRCSCNSSEPDSRSVFDD